ncbi:MAG TPA: hypothetical protein ENN31_00710 [Candidatus Vogelbacteria bacterium]|nr:hypothetical protein [Candidatus Vogelbacteria bacterium]
MERGHRITAIILSLLIVIIAFWGFSFFFRSELARVLPIGNNKISIGYCSNIDNYGDKLVGKYDYLQKIPYDNSNLTLNDLKVGKIDLALASRRALSDELAPGTKEKLLEDNFVLVYHLPGSLHYRDLQEMTLRTYLPEEEVRKALPSKTKVITDLDKDNIQEEDLQDLLILKWSDFQDDYHFVSVYDDFGTRQEFRAPWLYYFDERFADLEL